jgi:hypothetical protein
LKDIIVKRAQFVRELKIFGLCVLLALGINFLSILYFKTQWRELITTLHVTLILGFIFYGLGCVLRLGVRAGRAVVSRFKKT